MGDDVHVWQAALDAGPETEAGCRALLADDERARADQFLFEAHRRRFAVARAVLRRLLGLYLGTDARRVSLAARTGGKPALAAPDGRPPILRFNLSHSRDRALYAFARGREVGVDLEYVREGWDAEALAARFLAPGERAAIDALPAAERSRAFFACWARKEACLKACGTGIALDLKGVDTGAPGAGHPLPVDLQPPGGRHTRWWIRDLDLPHPWVGSLATEHDNGSVFARDWPDAWTLAPAR